MSKHTEDSLVKLTLPKLQAYKRDGRAIAMLTAYDYTMAKLIDSAGVDMILVGDSASNVMAGHATTLPITLDEMIYHGRSVVRAVKRAFVVVDMPFGSYQINKEQAITSAIRIMKETGADAVKLEGGKEVAESIRSIVNAGIPVVGHLGLTPQSVHAFGGYQLRAKTKEEAERLMEDSGLLQSIGCSFLVLEKIPSALASDVSRSLSIPVIGIGAGVGVDGQVLVSQDMLGMNDGFSPKFLRRFANVGQQIEQAVREYVESVSNRSFPNDTEAY